VTLPAHGRGPLADRLRRLRQSADADLTQRQLADVLGTSAALISSWESGQAVPPEHRLEAYGRFFATARSLAEQPPRLAEPDELTTEELRHVQELVEELVQLREETVRPQASARREAGALGGRFWHFPDGQGITILCTPMSRRQLGLNDNGTIPPDAPPVTAYSRRSHPNYVGSLRNADTDAVTELVGHIRAENPTAEVRWRTFDQVRDPDELTGHLVILGGADAPPRVVGNTDTLDAEGLVGPLLSRLELPVRTRIPDGGDEEFDVEFVVTVDEEDEPTYLGPRQEVFRPRFRRDRSDPARSLVLVDGFPQLDYDVALVARKTNPLNVSARITMCVGGFSRGTYGAARTFTDARLRTRNERYVLDHVRDDNDFWMLFHVPVVGGRTITPDLERAFHRLRISS
jgi:transcriptional regulator with XRE-family HTH domain